MFTLEMAADCVSQLREYNQSKHANSKMYFDRITGEMHSAYQCHYELFTHFVDFFNFETPAEQQFFAKLCGFLIAEDCEIL